MRELGILHDADESGALLHFFTEMVGGRLFFEVVERIGSYDGYGAANSPVRLSAQLRPALASRVAEAPQASVVEAERTSPASLP
jgi:4-hydroxyphenylpyruvate dioxygenase